MFNNVGEKIQKLAQILFVIGTLASLITAIVLMFTIERIGLPIGMAVLVVAPTLFLISTWFLYGYGEIIQNTAKTAKNTERIARNIVANSTLATEPQGNTISERAQKLKSLRDAGLITEAEYLEAISRKQ